MKAQNSYTVYWTGFNSNGEPVDEVSEYGSDKYLSWADAEKRALREANRDGFKAVSVYKIERTRANGINSR